MKNEVLATAVSLYKKLERYNELLKQLKNQEKKCQIILKSGIDSYEIDDMFSFEDLEKTIIQNIKAIKEEIELL